MSEATEQGALFAQLLLRHERSLTGYIRPLVPRREDAEDVLQRAVTVLWEKFADYDRNRAFLPWAIAITHFEVLKYRREMARSRLVFREELLHALAETRAAHEPLWEAQWSALQKCLRLLDAESVELLRRRYCDSETMAALARRCGKPVKSIYNRLYRLRERIAHCAEQQLARDAS